jgi:Secretion system C-terminal sorting domain
MKKLVYCLVSFVMVHCALIIENCQCQLVSLFLKQTNSQKIFIHKLNLITMKKIIYTFLILAFAVSLNAQWVQYSNGIGSYNIPSFLSNGNTIFAGTEGFSSGPGAGVYSSTNFGASWTYSGLSPYSVECMALSGTNIFAGTRTAGIFLSTNNGVSWTAVNNGITVMRINALAVCGANVLAAQNGFTGLYRTTNNGVNWVPYGLTGLAVVSLGVSGNNVYAGTFNGTVAGVYSSADNGANWTPIGLTSEFVNCFAISGTKVFAGCEGGKVYLTSNNGGNWTLVNSGLPNNQISALAIIGSNLFAAMDSSSPFWGVYYSSNNGTNWIPKNDGFSQVPPTQSFLITSNYIFVGSGQQIWRRNISEFIGIKQISELVPSKYSLSQNYPNPFNPTTVIRFQLSVVGLTTLKVYDIMGREVQTLVNERLQPGTYETKFDGSQLTSGVYFYKLTSGDYTETKKLTLIK